MQVDLLAISISVNLKMTANAYQLHTYLANTTLKLSGFKQTDVLYVDKRLVLVS